MYQDYFRFGITGQSIPDEIHEEIFSWRYRSHFGLSVEEFEREPADALYQARLIWNNEASAEKDRAQASSK